jgi:hypothetical protein
MSKHILTEQKKFMDSFRSIKEESVNENILDNLFKQVANSIKNDIKDHIKDEISGANKTKSTIKDLSLKIKEYMSKLVDAFGLDAVKRPGAVRKDLVPRRERYKGASMDEMSANIRKLVDNIIDSFDSYYLITNDKENKILKQLELKKIVTTQFKQLDNYRLLAEGTKDFIDLIDSFGYASLMNEPSVQKMKEVYDDYVRQMQNLYKRYYRDDFLDYFRLRLSQEFDDSITTADTGSENNFLIRNRQELDSFYKKSIAVDFNPKTTFSKSTDNSISIRKQFLLDYTEYTSSTQLTAVSIHLLSYLVVYKSKVTNISKTVDDYFIDDYIEDADHIVNSLLRVRGLDFSKANTKRAKNLNNAAKHTLFMNGLMFLVANFKTGYTPSKGGFYRIDNWEKGLTDMFEFFFVTKREEFDRYFRTISADQIDSIDMYSNSENKKVAEKYMLELNKTLTADDLDNKNLNYNPNMKDLNKKVAVMNKEKPSKDEINDAGFDSYNNDHYYKGAWFKDNAHYTFLNLNTTQSHKSVLDKLHPILHDLILAMDKVDSGGDHNFVYLLNIRDEYLENTHHPFLKDGEIPIEKQADTSIKIITENIFYILVYSDLYLRKDLTALGKCSEAIDFYRKEIDPKANLSKLLKKEEVEFEFINYIKNENKKLILKIGKTHFNDINVIKPLVQKFEDEYGTQKIELYTAKEIDKFFIKAKDEVRDEALNFTEFRNYIKNVVSKEYFTYYADYIAAIKEGFLGKSLNSSKEAKIDIKQDPRNKARNAFLATLDLVEILIDKLKIPVSDLESEKYSDKLNMIANVPTIYKVLVDQKAKIKGKEHLSENISYRDILNSFKKLKNDISKNLDYKFIAKKLK